MTTLSAEKPFWLMGADGQLQRVAPCGASAGVRGGWQVWAEDYWRITDYQCQDG